MIPLCFDGLNALLGGGLMPGEVMLLAGATSCGKSALGGYMAARLCIDHPLNSLILNTEMGVEGALDRIMAALSGVDSRKISGASALSDSERKALQAATERPILGRGTIINPADRTIESMLRPGEQWQLVVVDRLEDLTSARDVHSPPMRRIEVLKAIAAEHGFAAVAIDGVIAPEEARSERDPMGQRYRPTLDDVNANAAVADVVLFMSRVSEQDVELTVAKNRRGQLGLIRVRYDRHLSRFEERR